MSLTFLAKSLAYSWKMSFCGQVLCQRIEIGPCALTTFGKPRAAAPAAATAAPVRNLRREGSGVACWISLMESLLVVHWLEVRGRGRDVSTAVIGAVAARRPVAQPIGYTVMLSSLMRALRLPHSPMASAEPGPPPRPGAPRAAQ